VLVEVMTEKAAVEVPAPVSGRVLSTTGSPGDMVPVGAELIVLETQSDAAAQAPPAPAAKSAPIAAALSATPAMTSVGGNGAAAVTGDAGCGRGPRRGRRHLPGHSPPRARGRDRPAADCRLRPNGRIVPKDLDAYVARRAPQPTPLRAAPKQCPRPELPSRASRRAAPRKEIPR